MINEMSDEDMKIIVDKWIEILYNLILAWKWTLKTEQNKKRQR